MIRSSRRPVLCLLFEDCPAPQFGRHDAATRQSRGLSMRIGITPRSRVSVLEGFAAPPASPFGCVARCRRSRGGGRVRTFTGQRCASPRLPPRVRLGRVKGIKRSRDDSGRRVASPHLAGPGRRASRITTIDSRSAGACRWRDRGLLAHSGFPPWRERRGEVGNEEDPLRPISAALAFAGIVVRHDRLLLRWRCRWSLVVIASNRPLADQRRRAPFVQRAVLAASRKPRKRARSVAMTSRFGYRPAEQHGRISSRRRQTGIDRRAATSGLIDRLQGRRVRRQGVIFVHRSTSITAQADRSFRCTSASSRTGRRRSPLRERREMVIRSFDKAPRMAGPIAASRAGDAGRGIRRRGVPGPSAERRSRVAGSRSRQGRADKSRAAWVISIWCLVEA